VWNPVQLGCGDSSVDADHEKLVGMLNDLADAAHSVDSTPASIDRVRASFVRFQGHTVRHNARELELLRSSGSCPAKVKILQAEIQRFSAKVERWLLIMNKSDANEFAKLVKQERDQSLNYLNVWLHVHIKQTHKKIEPHLKVARRNMGMLLDARIRQVLGLREMCWLPTLSQVFLDNLEMEIRSSLDEADYELLMHKGSNYTSTVARRQTAAHPVYNAAW